MIRRALKSEIVSIVGLIQVGCAGGQVLPRSRKEITRVWNHCFVCVFDGLIIGCCQLDVYNQKLAEIRSLVVHPRFQNQGIGSKLIQKCLEEAKSRGIDEVLAITTENELFGRFGFRGELASGKKPLLLKL